MALKTQGTELWMIYGVTPAVVKIGCPAGITGLGGSKTQVNVTCLDSTEQEFISGMAQPGQLTVDLNFDPADISHQNLIDLFDTGETIHWAVGLADGTDAPTITSGAFVFPATRTFIGFDGYVADLPIDIGLDAAIKSQMQVQRSGARTFAFKT